MSFRRVPCRDVVVANDGVHGCADVVTCPSDECHAVMSWWLMTVSMVVVTSLWRVLQTSAMP